MDIEDLYTIEAHEEGAEMRVIDQYGKPTDMYISIYGVDSIEWRSEKLNTEKMALKNYKEFDEDEKADGIKIAKAASKLTSQSLANITIGWRGFTSKGEELEFTKEKAAEIYYCAPYIREQLDDFFSARVNFTKGRATN